MIVKCLDGYFYKNPVWYYDRMTVTADLDIEAAYAYHRPVKTRALAKPLRQLIGQVLLAERGHMGMALVGGVFQQAYVISLCLLGEPKPPNGGYTAKFEIRPGDEEDEIIDDYGIEAIKSRRAAWTSKK